METINFEEFKKLDIRIGKIISAERVEGSDKLLKLKVNFGSMPGLDPKGEENAAQKFAEEDVRQIIAGIAQFYDAEALIGKECPFVYNLAPRMLKGLESQGMLLCPLADGNPVLMHPDKEIPPGSVVK